MIVTASQFWQKLESTGLASAEECRRFAADMAEEVPADQMLETDSVAAWLLSKKVITPYQAKVLLGQRKGPLACGSYTVHAEVNDPVLRSWYRATHKSGAGEYWLFAMPEDLLQRDELLTNPPSLQLARSHAAIEEPLLCMLSVPQFSDGYLCFASSIAEGRSLLSTMQGVAMPAATAKQIVIQVAIALDRIHQASLVHGDIGMHSVWWDGDQNIRLIRDPLFLPSNPLADVHRVSTIQTDQIQRLRYAAPEFTVPGQRPTIETDLYALGCLWFELLSGFPLIQEKEPNAITKATLNATAKTRRIGALALPAQRMLNHLLAPNPAHRFTSVLQFLTALQTIARSTSSASGHDSAESAQKPAPTKSLNGSSPQSPTNSEASEKSNLKRQSWKQEPVAKSEPAAPVVSKVSSTPEPNGKAELKDQKATSPKTASAQQPKQNVASVVPKDVSPGQQPKPIEPVLATKPTVAPNVPAKVAPTKVTGAPTETVTQLNKKTDAQPASKPAPPQKLPTTVQDVVPKSKLDLEQAKPASPLKVPASTAEATLAGVKSEPVKSAIEASKKVSPQVAAQTTKPQQPSLEVQGVAPKSPNLVPSQPTSQVVALKDAGDGPIEKAKQAANPSAAVKSDLFELPFGDVTSPAADSSAKSTPKPEDAFNLDTSLFEVTPRPSNLPKTKARSAKQPAWLIPAAIGGGVLVVLALVYFLLTTKTPVKQEKAPATSSSETPVVPVQTPEATPEPTSSDDPLAQKFELVDDDKATLWSPPSVPDPLKLDLLPPGTQGVLRLNLRQIFDKAAYQQIDSVVHPAYEAFAQVVTDRLPLPLKEWEAVTVGLYPNETAQFPDVLVRGELRDAKSIEELLKKFQFAGPAQDLQLGDKKFKTNSNDDVSIVALVEIADETTTKSISIGPPKLIKEWVSVEGAVVPLTRQLETLRQSSSSKYDVTFLANASLLLTSGKGMIKESLVGLEPSLRHYMQEDVAAISIASNIDDNWYGEIRVVGKDAQIAPKIQRELESILKEVPDDAEATLVSQMSEPYWNKVALRMPQQLRTLQQQARVGIENGHAVANFYLPSKAAGNLVFSTWMAMRSPLQADKNSVAATSPPQEVLTMEEALKTPMTIKFDQESLESGARELQSAFGDVAKNPGSAIQIVINGAALEKDGITRNQQIRGFSHENKPLREVLLSLVRKANPVTTVQNPNEKDQKLIWVVKDADKKVIEITTRNDATTNNKKIPDEFVLAP